MRRFRLWLLVGTFAVAVLATTGGASAKSQIKVGLVVGPAGVSDPFFRGPYQGVKRAVRQLGVDGRVLTSGPREGTGGPAFTSLARQGYDLILGVGYISSGAMDRVARNFPHSRFVSIDASIGDLPHRPPNVHGLVFRSQEAGYLAGYLAGLMELRRPGRDVVGTVGGIKIPAVDAFIAGFQAGARKAAPRVRTLNGYAGDFLNAKRCAAVARGQIARGAGVVFSVAGGCGLGALREAQAANVWGIGVDIDQSTLGPHILTSAVKRLDVAVFRTIRAFQQGRLRFRRDTSFGLRNEGVGLGRLSPRVPRALALRIEPIRRAIAAGTIKVPARLSN